MTVGAWPAASGSLAGLLAAGEAPRVLLLGPEPEEAARLVSFLRRVGFEAEATGLPVIAEEDGCPDTRAVQGLASRFDLAVVWLSEPDVQAREWVPVLRGLLRLPVVVASSDNRYESRVAALRAGAEDYVCRPLSPSEVALRLRAIYRRVGSRRVAQGPGGRSGQAAAHGLTVGPLSLERETRRAAVGGRSLDLTCREFNLLWLLASNPGRVFSRDELMLKLWGDEEAASQECVTVLVSRLRRKLRRAGAPPRLRIRALWGVGYRLEGPSPALPLSEAPVALGAGAALSLR
ncbi:MAG: response regulator transcription factor [Bacillota bacterium]